MKSSDANAQKGAMIFEFLRLSRADSLSLFFLSRALSLSLFARVCLCVSVCVCLSV